MQIGSSEIKSSLQLYSELTALRTEPSFLKGNMRVTVRNEEVFSFTRHVTSRHPTYLVALNLGDKPSTDDHTVADSNILFKCGDVVMTSCNLHLETGSHIDITNLTLNAGQGIVVKLHAHLL